MFHFFNVVEPHLDNQCQATKMFLYDQWGSKINRVFRYMNMSVQVFAEAPRKVSKLYGLFGCMNWMVIT